MLYSYNALIRKMKLFRFYRNKNKDTTPESLSRILDLAENDSLSHKNEDDLIKITILPPPMLLETSQTKNLAMKTAREKSIIYQEVGCKPQLKLIVKEAQRLKMTMNRQKRNR